MGREEGWKDWREAVESYGISRDYVERLGWGHFGRLGKGSLLKWKGGGNGGGGFLCARRRIASLNDFVTDTRSGKGHLIYKSKSHGSKSQII